jgi:hypothetical protein
MSSDMSGEVEKKESQTMVKTIFASLNWYSKIPEVDLVYLCPPKDEPTNITAGEQRGDPTTDVQLLPVLQSISTSSSC